MRLFHVFSLGIECAFIFLSIVLLSYNFLLKCNIIDCTHYICQRYYLHKVNHLFWNSSKFQSKIESIFWVAVPLSPILGSADSTESVLLCVTGISIILLIVCILALNSPLAVWWAAVKQTGDQTPQPNLETKSISGCNHSQLRSSMV